MTSVQLTKQLQEIQDTRELKSLNPKAEVVLHSHLPACSPLLASSFEPYRSIVQNRCFSGLVLAAQSVAPPHPYD